MSDQGLNNSRVETTPCAVENKKKLGYSRYLCIAHTSELNSQNNTQLRPRVKGFDTDKYEGKPQGLRLQDLNCLDTSIYNSAVCSVCHKGKLAQYENTAAQWGLYSQLYVKCTH